MRLQAASPLIAVGKYGEAEELLSSLAADEPEIQAEAALVLARARSWQGELAAANREVDRGLALVSGTGVPVEVRLWIERARLSLLLNRDSDSRRIIEKAQSLIGATGVDRASATWLTGQTAFQDGDATCLDHFRAAIVTAQETGDLMLECEAEASLMDALQAFGEPQAARARANHILARAGALDHRGWEETFRYVLARLDALCRGAYAEAVPALEALLLRGYLGVRRREACALLAHVLGHLGDEAAARTWLARETGKDRDAWAADLLILVAGEVNWLAGRPEQALAGIEESRANGIDGRHYPTPLTSLHGLIERWALLDLGFAPGPELEIDLPCIEGARTESAALARMIDRYAALEAEDLFEEAAKKWTSHSASSEIRCLWAAGEAARRAGKLDRARRRLRIAEQRARGRGFEPLLQRIRISLREAGVNRRTTAVTAPVLKAKSGRELTSREREVLRLVGAGLSSRDVARLLHIAPSTVETQIRSGMRKLGATTRVQAASLIWFRAEGTDADDASSVEPSIPPDERDQ
jgi:DNA-binding CsgD family transcriptional regulator